MHPSRGRWIITTRPQGNNPALVPVSILVLVGSSGPGSMWSVTAACTPRLDSDAPGRSLYLPGPSGHHPPIGSRARYASFYSHLDRYIAMCFEARTCAAVRLQDAIDSDTGADKLKIISESPSILCSAVVLSLSGRGGGGGGRGAESDVCKGS